MYWIARFGNIVLPIYNPVDDIGPGTARTSFVALPGGGAFDALGSGRGNRGDYPLKHTGMILKADPASLEADYDALTAAWDTRNKLYRHSETGRVHWTWARLIGLPIERRPQDVYRYRGYFALDVTCEFRVFSPYWYGTYHGDGLDLTDPGVEAFDTGLALDYTGQDLYTLDTSPKTLAIPNAGNAPVINAILTLTAAGSPITAVTITGGGADLTWTGTLAAGTALVIDAGARSVKNAGADAYGGLVFNAGHAVDEWLRIAPGGTSLTITRTGGDATSTLLTTFYEAWV